MQIRASDIRVERIGEQWINPGDSVVVAPGGEMVAGPLHEQQAIHYAEIDLSRADIFTLQVNRRRQSPIEFDG